jgi:hypothetical protein
VSRSRGTARHSRYGIAVLDREKLDEGELHAGCQNCFNQLKRKENALALPHGSIVGSEIGWTGLITKMIENWMLGRRFSVAPLMDWTDVSMVTTS